MRVGRIVNTVDVYGSGMQQHRVVRTQTFSRLTVSLFQRHGMVLVDALVATVLLGLSLAVVMSLVSRALTLQREGERLEVAAMLVDEQLNLVLARGADSYASRFGLAGKCDVPYQDYSYVLTFEGAGGTDAFLVTATVSWRDGGRERKESVQTRIAARRGEDADPERKPKDAVERF